MDYKKTINNFKANEDNLRIQINLLRACYEDEEKLWTEMEKLKEEAFLNPQIINFLADSLQMVDDKKRLDLFELVDIKEIYQLLVKAYPDNIQYQIDQIAFVHNVLDDEVEALDLINKSIELIDEKKNYLDDLLVNINEGKNKI